MTWVDSPQPKGAKWSQELTSTPVRKNCSNQNVEGPPKAKANRLPPCTEKSSAKKEQIPFNRYESTPVRLRKKTQTPGVVLSPSDCTPVRTNCTNQTNGTEVTTRKTKSNRLPPSRKKVTLREAKVPVGPTKQVVARESLSKKRTLQSILSSPRDSIRDGGEQWRKHGKDFRARLLIEEDSAGNSFAVSSRSNIKRYYDIAEKVYDQFLNSPLDYKSELAEAYLIGNRLVHFLSRVLPTHKDYRSNHNGFMAGLRDKSQTQLLQLIQYLGRLEILIDEEEFNSFILLDLSDEVNKSSDLPEGLHKSSSPDRIGDAASTDGYIDYPNSKLEKEDQSTLKSTISPNMNEKQVKSSDGSSDGSSLISFERIARSDNHQTQQPMKDMNDASRTWDTQFSQYGTDRGNRSIKEANPPIYSASILDSSVYLADGQSHSEFSVPTENGEDAAWTPTDMDPFAKRISPLKPPRKALYLQDRKTSKKQVSPLSKPYTLGSYLAAYDREERHLSVEPLKTFESHSSSTFASSLVSQETPTKADKIQRDEISPTSVVFLDGLDTDLNRPDKNDAYYTIREDDSLLSGSESRIEPHYPRQRTLQKFKGCVKCFSAKEQDTHY